MAAETIYLITGANRGIGRGLTQEFLSRPNTTVIASVRDVETPSSRSLESLPAGSGSKLIIVKIDSLSESDARDAVELLKAKYLVDHLDCVIANAGISNDFNKATDVSAQAMGDHFNVNTVGPLLLFQATRPLLQAAKQPKFVIISSTMGSIGGMDNMPMHPLVAYGASKAAVNFVTRKIHFENQWLIAFVMRPGWVQTDMGNAGAKAVGMEKAPVAIEASVKGLVAKVESATRENASGRFVSYDDGVALW